MPTLVRQTLCIVYITGIPENTSIQAAQMKGMGSAAPGGDGKGDHHFTVSSQERDALVSAGWTDEGIGWYSSDDNRSFPLQRQYNPYAHTGTHNYTLNPGEASYLISRGRRDEGVAWYGIDGASSAPWGTSPSEAPFKNCKAVRAAGRAPIYRGDPGYSSKLDTDNDGIGCE